MKWITKLFGNTRTDQGGAHAHRASRNFLRLLSPDFDQSFQLPDNFSLEAAKAAQKSRDYLLFNTYRGSQCAVNFANIQAMLHSQEPEIEWSSYEISGIRMYFANNEQFLEVPATPAEGANFFSSLASSEITVQLGGWTIDKSRILIALGSNDE